MKLDFIPFALFLAQDACAPKHQSISCYDINGKPYFTMEDVEVHASADGWFTLYEPGSTETSIGEAHGNCIVVPYHHPAEKQ